MFGSWKRARVPFYCALFALSLDCATLEKLTLGACGNGVLDPGEDCDGTHPGDQGKCGAPTTDQACHYTCTAKTAAQDCPAGWGCSVLGTCAGPSGVFLPARDAQSAGVRTMLAGDFNGDGRKDILGLGGLGGDNAAKARIHFAEADGELKEIIALPGLMTSPFVIDINRDGLADILFGYFDPSIQASGIGLLKGQRERNFVPELFTSFGVTGAKLVAATLPSTGTDTPGQESNLVAVAEAKDASGVSRFTLESLGSSGYVRALAVGPDALIGGRLYTGRMFREPQSACGEAVVAFKEGTTLKAQIFSPCTRVNGKVAFAPETPPKEVTIANATDPGVFVGDVDGDGLDDLVLSRVATEPAVVFTSTGTGLAAQKPFKIPVPAPDLVTVDQIGFGAAPIASGDINGDGIPEIVYPFGVFVSNPTQTGVDAGGPKPLRYGFRQSARPWTIARIVDLNKDGAPEIVAASNVEPDIDVLELRNGVFLPGFTVSTRGPVFDLATLDLDFDGLVDIVSLDVPSATDERFVSVSYGRLTMPPEPAKAIGRLSDLQQVLVTNGGLAVSRRVQPAGAALPDFFVAIVFPSSERQPIAPLLFDDSLAMKRVRIISDWRPSALVAGPIASSETDDLVTLGIGETDAVNDENARGIWLARGTADRRFGSLNEIMSLDQIDVFDRGTRALRFAMTVGDLNGDLRSEVIGVTDDRTGGVAVRIFNVAAGGEGNPARTEVSLPDRRLPDASRFDPRVDLLDVDGDGKLDLVALLADKPGPNAALKVDVLFGDGAGSFVTPALTVQLPARGPTDPPWQPTSVAQLTTVSAERDFTGKARKDLFIITATNLFQATLAPDRSSFTVRDVTSFLEGGLTYGTGLVSGDFDGDGVEDLAIAVDGAIRILRQKPRGN